MSQKISLNQVFVIVVLMTIGDSIILLPASVAIEAKRDAWLSGIFGVGLGILQVYFYLLLSNRYPNQTLFEYIEETILGKWIGKTISLFFFSFFFLLAALELRQIGDFFTTHFMSETPIQAIMIIFLLIIIYGVKLGLEPIAKTSEILFPWVIIFWIFMMLLNLPNIQFNKILPILDNGIKPVLRGSITFYSFPYMEIVSLLVILPYVRKSTGLKKNVLLSAFLGGIILIITTTLCILVLGSDITSIQTYTTYTLAKKISIGGIIERVEAIIAFLWCITIFTKMIITFYCAIFGLSYILGVKDYRILTLPLSMILLILAIISAPNIIYYNEVISLYWPFYAFTFSFLLPLVLYVTSFFRSKNNH